jgi:hypothetical protein
VPAGTTTEETSDLQKRQASSKLSGHFTQGLGESQHHPTRRNRIGRSPKWSTRWKSKLGIWGT